MTTFIEMVVQMTKSLDEGNEPLVYLHTNHFNHQTFQSSNEFSAKESVLNTLFPRGCDGDVYLLSTMLDSITGDTNKDPVGSKEGAPVKATNVRVWTTTRRGKNIKIDSNTE